MFVFALILIVLAIGAFLLASSLSRREPAPAGSSTGMSAQSLRRGTLGSRIAGAVLAVVALVFLFASSTYTQDVGESNVLKDWTGNVLGQETGSGLHFKAPWVDTVTFNIRNQQVVFAGKQPDNPDGTGGRALGPEVTVQDQDGVTSNVDVAVRYSINPGAVDSIYKSFKSEDNFKTSFVEQDIRGAVRQIPNSFSTINLITKRSKVEAAILTEITSRWKGTGVSIDSVSLQEIRPPKSVVESYAAAQQAQINVAKEKSNLESVKVSAQQKVVQAQAEADANAILTASLTPQILQSRYLDALKDGTVYVVPEGSTPFIGAANPSK